MCPDLLRNDQGLVIRDWFHALLSQALQGSRVLSQVELRTNEDNWDGRSMVVNLGEPLCANVVKRRRRNDGEADQEDISLGVRERTQSIIILLSCGIPQTQADRLAINHHTG